MDQPERGLAGLVPIGEAATPNEAMGLWWAHAALHHAFEDGVTADPAVEQLKDFATTASVAQRCGVEETVGRFAAELTSLLEETNTRGIVMNYKAHPLLLEAAKRAEMPANPMTTFPWFASTIAAPTTSGDWLVFAKEGYGTPDQQVWPPLPEA